MARDSIILISRYLGSSNGGGRAYEWIWQNNNRSSQDGNWMVRGQSDSANRYDNKKSHEAGRPLGFRPSRPEQIQQDVEAIEK